MKKTKLDREQSCFMTKTVVVKTFEIIISALASDMVDCDNESFIPTSLENARLGKVELA